MISAKCVWNRHSCVIRSSATHWTGSEKSSHFAFDSTGWNVWKLNLTHVSLTIFSFRLVCARLHSRNYVYTYHSTTSWTAANWIRSVPRKFTIYLNFGLRASLTRRRHIACMWKFYCCLFSTWLSCSVAARDSNATTNRMRRKIEINYYSELDRGKMNKMRVYETSASGYVSLVCSRAVSKLIQSSSVQAAPTYSHMSEAEDFVRFKFRSGFVFCVCIYRIAIGSRRHMIR